MFIKNSLLHWQEDKPAVYELYYQLVLDEQLYLLMFI